VLRLPVDGTGTPAAILEFIEEKLIAPLALSDHPKTGQP
jgi:hypothetical protein